MPQLPGPDRNRRVEPVYIALIKTNYGYVGGPPLNITVYTR